MGFNCFRGDRGLWLVGVAMTQEAGPQPQSGAPLLCVGTGFMHPVGCTSEVNKYNKLRQSRRLKTKHVVKLTETNGIKSRSAVGREERCCEGKKRKLSVSQRRQEMKEK